MSNFTEPHHCQLPKGCSFWEVERFKPAQLTPPSCHLPETHHHTAAQAIIPWCLDKDVSASCTAQVSWMMDHPKHCDLWDTEHPWSFPVQGLPASISFGPFAVASEAPAVPAAAVVFQCCCSCSVVQIPIRRNKAHRVLLTTGVSLNISQPYRHSH